MMHIKQIRNFKELNKGHNSMKKLLLGVVLMLVSSIATSATITIGNPVTQNSGAFTSTPTFTNITNTTTTRTDTINTGINGFAVFVGLSSGDFTTSWNISSNENVGFTLDLTSNHTNRSNWSISIFDTVSETLSTYAYGSSFDLVMSAGNSIVVSVLGSIGAIQAKSFNTTLSISNLEVSEVPLPAAVWLFGSVLLGGLAFRRKAAQKRQLALAV